MSPNRIEFRWARAFAVLVLAAASAPCLAGEGRVESVSGKLIEYKDDKGVVTYGIDGQLAGVFFLDLSKLSEAHRKLVKEAVGKNITLKGTVTEAKGMKTLVATELAGPRASLTGQQETVTGTLVHFPDKKGLEEWAIDRRRQWQMNLDLSKLDAARKKQLEAKVDQQVTLTGVRTMPMVDETIVFVVSGF